MIEQLTPEWHQERAGKLTGSCFAAALGLSPYMSRQKLWRLLTGREQQQPGNAAMEYGVIHEPIAIDWYECETGNLVTQVGFVPHGDYLGASPDGLVGRDGAIEVKAPLAKAHESIPEHYMPQCVGVLHICKRQWLDFISWHPERQIVHRITAEKTASLWASWEAQLIEFYEQFVLADREPPRKRRSNARSGEVV